MDKLIDFLSYIGIIMVFASVPVALLDRNSTSMQIVSVGLYVAGALLLVGSAVLRKLS